MLLFFKIKLIFLIEEIKVVFYFYRNIQFALFDLLFKLNYFFINPYRLSRKFIQKKGDKKLYTYGETPLSAFSKIIDLCDITSSDTFYELGSGRARVSFWMHYFKECSVISIEQIPKFMNISKRLTQWMNMKNIEFHQEDIFQFPLDKATFIYLYGTTLSDDEIYHLLRQFFYLKPKTKILTISYPLTDYDSKSYRLLKEMPIRFPWGKTHAYLQEKIRV